ncbi:unnamed protein product [Umbelopsis vinacea]
MMNFIKLEHITFGGDLIVFGGDFRQFSSVLPRGTCAQIVDQCMNRSIHLLELPATLDLDVVAGHEDLERVDAWNRGRRLVFVGTSAPQTTFDRPAYQGRLDEEVSPVTNLTTESESSPALNTVLNIATDDGDDEAEYEDDETPPFIDHHPRIVSERFRDMAQNLDLDALVHDDQALKDSTAALNRDVITYNDVSTRTEKKLLNKKAKFYEASVAHLEMQQHWPNTIGIPPEQAQSLREWLTDHPTSIQLDLA